MASLGDLFTDIADAIRTKTGEEGTMKPIDFPSKIESISVGGGSSELVGYVTFMNGGVELYKMPFIKGYDCPNPLTEGLIETPTKESTVSTNYTYSGWDNNLTDLTEDVVVNAVFSESVRYYTINFYDGETLIESQSVAYGEKPSISNPEKDGYNFDGWEPTLSVVTGNASYYAVWGELPTFAGASWEQIAEISEAGNASTIFSVGDAKTIEFDGTTATVRIIGFNHDELADGTGKAGITMFCETASTDTFAVNNWSTLSTNMENTLLPKLPEGLQNHIKKVNKDCDTELLNQVITPVTISFSLFPLSFTECYIRKYNSTWDTDWENNFTTLGSPYDYFKSKYQSSHGGPGYYVGFYSLLDCWFRQWHRMSTGIKGLYRYNLFTTTNDQWAKTDTYTNLRTVMFAFCI